MPVPARRATLIRSLFAALVLGLALCGARIWQMGAAIDTDLLGLLPPAEFTPAVQDAVQRVQSQEQDTLLYLLSAAQREPLAAAAKRLQGLLAADAHFAPASVAERAGEAAGYIAFLTPYRFGLLDDRTRGQLAAGGQALARARLRDLYAPAGAAAALSPAQDPLGTFDRYLDGMHSGPAMAPEGAAGWFSARGRHYALFAVTVLPGSFDLDAQAAVLALDAELASLPAEVEVLRAGAVLHAAGAARQARGEIMLISLGSVTGIVALFLAAFGSLRPLLLSLASVLFGVASAALVTLALYRDIHLLTLVFGATLIGVGVDYALHYLTRAAETGSGNAVLDGLLPGLALALVTSLLGFGSLWQAPLPGLQQMAVFAMTGLVGAWLFVVAVFPVATAGVGVTGAAVGRLSGLPARLLGVRALRWAVLLAVAAVGLAGLARLQTGSDVRLLHAPDPALLREQGAIAEVLPSPAPNQFLLLRGASLDAVLARCEALAGPLAELVAAGAVRGWQGPCRHLPSAARQRENRALLAAAYGPGGAGERLAQQLGLERIRREQLAAALADAPLLDAPTWLAAAPPGVNRLLFAGGEGSHAVIQLDGLADVAAPARLAADHEWLTFVDTVGDVSATLEHHLRLALRMLFAAYGVIGLVLLVRYRQVDALRLLLVPGLASLAAVGLLGLAGQPLNLFHAFALYLVLGLGMDYSIFGREAGEHQGGCRAAVFLSFATSVLSFGLLSLSSTPLLAAFGLTVLLGSIGNWLLAPLATGPAPTHSPPTYWPRR